MHDFIFNALYMHDYLFNKIAIYARIKKYTHTIVD